MVDPFAADHDPNSARAQAAKSNAHAAGDGAAYDRLEEEGSAGRRAWGRQFAGQPAGHSRSVMAAVMLALETERILSTSTSTSAGAGAELRTVVAVSKNSKVENLDKVEQQMAKMKKKNTSSCVDG